MMENIVPQNQNKELYNLCYARSVQKYYKEKENLTNETWKYKKTD